MQGQGKSEGFQGYGRPRKSCRLEPCGIVIVEMAASVHTKLLLDGNQMTQKQNKSCVTGQHSVTTQLKGKGFRQPALNYVTQQASADAG